MKPVAVEISLAVAIVAVVVGTGIALVTTTHESRRQFQELEALRSEQDRLLDDWSALQLEVSTLAGHARIDEIARRELGMVDSDEHRVYVRRSP